MINNITKYFKSALIAKKQDVIDFKNSDEKYEIITKKEFVNGLIDLKVLKKFISENKIPNNDVIEVIIVPKTVKTYFENGKKINDNIDELTGILYVPAILSHEGKLEINHKNYKSPWIPREFLEPMIEPQLSLGKIDDVDKFLSNNTYQQKKVTKLE